MPTIAIVGAGRGIGLAIARKFGAHGFDVALIARNPDKLGRLEHTLGRDGIIKSFPADVNDQAGLAQAFKDAIEYFGSIDALEYSPADYASNHLAPVDVRTCNRRSSTTSTAA